jgi:hypothetical protein
VRVEVRDKDLFTPDDIIEQFDCKFSFRPGVRHPENWSNEAECRALHRTHQIKYVFMLGTTFPEKKTKKEKKEKKKKKKKKKKRKF